MTDFVADPNAIRGYGAASSAIGGVIDSASAMDLAANVAVMVPVFGLIGQDFLASFGMSQFANAVSTASLVAVHQGTAVSAVSTAAKYEGADGDTSAALNSAASSL
ncbi:type VII secretion target [Williamsia sp. MIQD14]|uniref:type VII secretion target n=1 Tax=Williamsia sp. MIQD14 TaxID=3425703 RepID=UPI003DA10E7E